MTAHRRPSRSGRHRPGASDAVTVRAPAKVNLHLGVGARRPDGFHELTTVFQAVSLYDDVTVAPADRLSVEVLGEGAADVPTGEDNLAVTAVRALAAYTGQDPAVRVVVRKAIPVAGGMAGGSADAAAALLACDTLWRTGLGRAGLHDLAARLGSDVPFALQGGIALGTGRGEHLSPVLARGDYHWVFALAASGLSTQRVYTQTDRMRGADPDPDVRPADGVLAALRAEDPVALGRALANDLQPAALRLRPSLGRVFEAGRELGALGAVVSGSGPTVALLVRSAGHGVDLAAALAGMDVCRAIRRAHGPVPGAQVVAPDGAAVLG